MAVKTLYIEPGAPWENGYAESFHSRLRDEFLAAEVFESLMAARKLTADWREDYNHHRPHSSLAYQTPAEFAHALCCFRSEARFGYASSNFSAPGAAALPSLYPQNR